VCVFECGGLCGVMFGVVWVCLGVGVCVCVVVRVGT